MSEKGLQILYKKDPILGIKNTHLDHCVDCWQIISSFTNAPVVSSLRLMKTPKSG